jgi:hypothetical protein
LTDCAFEGGISLAILANKFSEAVTPMFTVELSSEVAAKSGKTLNQKGGRVFNWSRKKRKVTIACVDEPLGYNMELEQARVIGELLRMSERQRILTRFHKSG